MKLAINIQKNDLLAQDVNSFQVILTHRQINYIILTNYKNIFSVNKPFKKRYKESWNEWIGDQTQQDFTQSGNRRKPDYAIVSDWVSNASNKISRDTIIKSLPACGIFYHVNEFNSLSFISNLNSRAKHILFITEKRVIYEQYMALCMLINCEFSLYDDFLSRIQQFIIKYRGNVKKSFDEGDKEEVVDESDLIEIEDDSILDTSDEDNLDDTILANLDN